MAISISQFSLSDPDFSAAFDRMCPLRLLGVAVDFQRILRAVSGLRRLEHSALDLEAFHEGPALGRGYRDSTSIYRRLTDGAPAGVKSVSLSALIGRSQIVTEIENLFH